MPEYYDLSKLDTDIQRLLTRRTLDLGTLIGIGRVLAGETEPDTFPKWNARLKQLKDDARTGLLAVTPAQSDGQINQHASTEPAGFRKYCDSVPSMPIYQEDDWLLAFRAVWDRAFKAAGTNPDSVAPVTYLKVDREAAIERYFKRCEEEGVRLSKDDHARELQKLPALKGATRDECRGWCEQYGSAVISERGRPKKTTA